MPDTLKMISCRLPQELISAAMRYADLYQSSTSELLRQGLEYRLSVPSASWPPPIGETGQSIPVDTLPTLAQHLTRVAAELERLASYGQTSQDPQPENDVTKPNYSTICPSLAPRLQAPGTGATDPAPVPEPVARSAQGNVPILAQAPEPVTAVQPAPARGKGHPVPPKKAECSHGHGPERWTIGKDGAGYCNECKRLRNQQRRAVKT